MLSGSSSTIITSASRRFSNSPASGSGADAAAALRELRSFIAVPFSSRELARRGVALLRNRYALRHLLQFSEDRLQPFALAVHGVPLETPRRLGESVITHRPRAAGQPMRKRGGLLAVRRLPARIKRRQPFPKPVRESVEDGSQTRIAHQSGDDGMLGCARWVAQRSS